MKKIGLLTMPVKENYGGIIQVAALYFYLKSEGYEPYLVNKRYDESLPKRIFRYLLSHNPLFFIYDYKNLTKREKQSTKLVAFINDYFKLKTIPLYNEMAFKENVKQFETIIVGSDQVWRYKNIRQNYKYYFLDFCEPTVNRVSYAASFGVDYWEGNEDSINHIKKLLKDFKAVSVRESSGQKICKDTFGVDNVSLVLDPTFLPPIEFYDKIIDGEKLNKKVSLFTYVLDSNDQVSEIIDYTSEFTKMDISTIKLTDYRNSVNPSLGEWLYNFKNADFVITDSFHGMVFSIIFKKQFICIGNKERGYSRFESLLDILQLKSRLVFDFDQSNIDGLLSNPIDYSEVDELITKWRSISINFLNDAIK